MRRTINYLDPDDDGAGADNLKRRYEDHVQGAWQELCNARNALAKAKDNLERRFAATTATCEIPFRNAERALSEQGYMSQSFVLPPPSGNESETNNILVLLCLVLEQRRLLRKGVTTLEDTGKAMRRLCDLVSEHAHNGEHPDPALKMLPWLFWNGMRDIPKHLRQVDDALEALQKAEDAVVSSNKAHKHALIRRSIELFRSRDSSQESLQAQDTAVEARWDNLCRAKKDRDVAQNALSKQYRQFNRVC